MKKTEHLYQAQKCFPNPDFQKVCLQKDPSEQTAEDIAWLKSKMIV